MNRRNKIIYWIFTLWLALGMFSTGTVQLMKVDTEVDKITQMGDAPSPLRCWYWRRKKIWHKVEASSSAL